jgi:hypothetical protein
MKSIVLMPPQRNFSFSYMTLLSLLCLLSFSTLVIAQNNGASSKRGTTTEKKSSAPPTTTASNSQYKWDKTSDRQLDGLTGPVRTVRTEVMRVGGKDGQPADQGKVLIDVSTYDLKGKKITAETYPNPYGISPSNGKESYKYDQKGNLIEMTVFGSDGALLHRENYVYEFDAMGNWIKMTTSIATFENGQIRFEPAEVTLRSISYYLNAKMLSTMADKAATPSSGGNNSLKPEAEPKQKKEADPIVIKKEDIKASSY